MWSHLHEENDVPHGNKVSSATIRVYVSPIKCTMLLKWLTESQYDLTHCTPWLILASWQKSNHRAEPKQKNLPNIWLMMPHALCKTMPSSPSPWLVMTTKVFFSPDVKCALQLVYCWQEIQSCIKSNQTSEAMSLWFSPDALPLDYLLCLMKDENHRCVECLSKSGNTMKDDHRTMKGSSGNT